MHRLVGRSVQAPAPELRQRVEDVRDQAPAELQAFQHATAAEVPAQHQRVDALQELGMPRHPHSRLHVRDLDHALAEVVVVRQPKLPRQVHGLDRRGVHEVALLVLRQQALLLIRRADGVLPTGARRQAGAQARVHSVARLVATEQADALREGRGVLREGDHVLPELRQPRLLRRHEVHLHVLERHEHGLGQRRGLEEARELLVGEHPHGVHVVPLPELRNEGSASAALVPHVLLLHQDVAPLAQARVHLRHEGRSLRL